MAETAVPGEYHPFLWENGVMTDLGTLGGEFGDANSINDEGRIIGNVKISEEWHGYLWEEGVIKTDFGEKTRANGINNLGQIIGQSFTGDIKGNAFIWEKGTMTALGTLGTSRTNYTAPEDINDAGQVVGGSQTTLGEMHPFLWENGVMTDLGHLGGETGGAHAINPTTTVKVI